MSKKIHLLGMDQKWSPGWDFHYLKKTLKDLDIPTSKSKFAFNSDVYLPNKYFLKRSLYHLLNNKIYFDYFHGHPIITPEFKNLFDYTIKNQNKYHRIRVTNNVMADLFSKAGISEKVRKIYLGVDNNLFKKVENNKVEKLKIDLKIPRDSIIVGSFQKDGIGWGEGTLPKMIKGPDILIETLIKLKNKFKNLFILLLGPSRGYVKKELKKNRLPFLHIYEDHYQNLYKYYNLLDFYLISSREEGGPKALLESMACGIPVISTPVGQSVELINDGINGLITNNYNSKNLSDKCIELVENESLKKKIIVEGKLTANSNDHNNQSNEWKDFFFN